MTVLIHWLLMLLIVVAPAVGHKPAAAPERHTAPPRANRGTPRKTLDWAALRRCESGGRYDADTGNGFYGAYQFDPSTWRSVGGQGNPAAAPPDEQDRRAALLFAQRGRAPWPICGARL